VGRNFSLLTAAAVITGLGGSGALVAAAFAVLQSGGDGTDVGLVAAARTVPLVAFLLLAGAVADRLPRHRVMVAANALNCLSQGAFALLVLTGQAVLWQMAVLSALGGTARAFFSPAAEGMVLSSVRGEHANRAFAIFRTGVNGANVGGAALGGALVAAAGPGWVLAADSAAFALSGALRALLDLRAMPQRQPAEGLLQQLREGWREVRSRTWLWSVIVQFAVVNAVVGAAEAVYGPEIAEESLGGARPWGIALAAFGVGTVGGALVMTRWRPRRILRAGVLSVFPLALPSAALAVPVSAPVLTGVMLVSGLCVEVFGVAWMMALHQEIPEEKFSRISSYDWLGSIAMVPLATAVAGPVEDAVGRSAALWGCSALIVALTATVLAVPDVRHLTRRTPRPSGSPGSSPGSSGDSSAAPNRLDSPASSDARAEPPTLKAPSGGTGEGGSSPS
jgi:MFS family permease